MANLPKPIALTNMLKRAELPVFYLVWDFVLIAGKKLFSYMIFYSIV